MTFILKCDIIEEREERGEKIMTEEYEIVCSECGKPFMSDDVNADVCPECWEKLILQDLENEGQG